MKGLYVSCLDLWAQARTRVASSPLIRQRSVTIMISSSSFEFFLRMALFRHTRDISPDGQKAWLTDGLTDRGAELTVLSCSTVSCHASNPAKSTCLKGSVTFDRRKLKSCGFRHEIDDEEIYKSTYLAHHEHSRSLVGHFWHENSI